MATNFNHFNHDTVKETLNWVKLDKWATFLIAALVLESLESF